MIKLVMLTGFLGSGKTTLLQKLIDEYADHRIGVLINEFGAVSIDSELVRRDGLEMTELSNGSIFCACIKDKFVEALVEISTRELEYLFIEASGLADPANMEDILKGLEGHLVHKYDYAHSICIVDGTSFMELKDVLEALRNQVAFSDIVILNKADLISEETVLEIEKAVSSINPGARLVVTSYADCDIRDLIGSPSGLSGRSQETSNTFSARPQTVILKERKTVPYEELEPFIREIAGSTYRIKGFLDTDRGGVKIDCVGEKLSITPWERRIKEAKVVVISSVGIRIVSVVTAAMTRYLKGSISL